MKNFEIDFIQDELERVSGWVRFADSKSAFLSAFYTLIFGYLISQRTAIADKVDYLDSWHNLGTILSILAGLSFLIGLFFLVKSVFPKLDNGSTDKSLFYFGHIANMKLVDYLDAVGKLDTETAKKQLFEQIHANSKIANIKMGNVKNSIKYLIVLAGILVFILLV